MKILLTGASSFTGFWFARVLAERGHTVYATFQGSRDSYDAPRRRRIDALPESVKCLWETSLGSERLLDAVTSEDGWDLVCLHGAYVTGYRNPDFDVVGALRNNTEGLQILLEKLAAKGLGNVLATGSVFEAEEGAGEEPLRAFSPYGLSKTLTWKVEQYLAQVLNLRLGKFLIPNPFGPYEEPRFTAYLIKTWYAGKTAEVRTPLYVRDNIHITNLAVHYARYAESLVAGQARLKCGPMGYVESQGSFTLRFAEEMRKRLEIPCEVILGQQTEFSEPLMRVNTQAETLPQSEWNEAAAWDELAAYYKTEFAPAPLVAAAG
jgi:UDP-glucose 4-epimerase